jgi:cell wall-associated NlpC family hydrolase
MAPTEAQQRADVVAEALTWLATEYHHYARVKGAGVDCAQFPAAVYEACGLIPHVEPQYAADWHLHHDEERYVEWVLKFARRIPDAQGRAGDVALWRWGRTYSHGGILMDPPQVIHSYVGVGVQIDDLTTHEELRTRPRLTFTLWGK